MPEYHADVRCGDERRVLTRGLQWLERKITKIDCDDDEGDNSRCQPKTEHVTYVMARDGTSGSNSVHGLRFRVSVDAHGDSPTPRHDGGGAF